MRTTVIPAQITTVEDTIAGNLNLTQILILMFPVIFTTLLYALFPEPMKITIYKIALSLASAMVCIILAIRVKGKVILNWLLILTTYYARPKTFVFNKNDDYLRSMDMPIEVNEKPLPAIEIKKASAHTKGNLSQNDSDIAKAESFVLSKNISIRFKLNRKGGFNVAFEPASS